MDVLRIIFIIDAVHYLGGEAHGCHVLHHMEVFIIAGDEDLC